jgi:hypothetical protein
MHYFRDQEAKERNFEYCDNGEFDGQTKNSV